MAAVRILAGRLRSSSHSPHGPLETDHDRLPPGPPEDSGSPFIRRDPWPWAEPYRLIGWAERERFHPVFLAFAALITTFVVFQIVAGLATFLFLYQEFQEVGLAGFQDLLLEYPVHTLAANAVGQVVGLLMLTVLFTRLHTPDVLTYLRVRRTDPAFYLLSGTGLVALIPFVSWIGEHARRLPYPEFIREADEAQRVLIEQIITPEINIVVALLLIALTPAICEEVIFRGYLQRNVERRYGVAASLVVVAIMFGLFHLRLTEFVPLTILGFYLGFVVWVSGSLWMGVLVHLMNNGFAVLVSNYAQTRPDPIALEELVVPWYYALLGLAVAIGLALVMLRKRRDHISATDGSSTSLS